MTKTRLYYGSGAKFIHSALVNANFSYANLTDADFSNADIRGINFSGANLYGAKLTIEQLRTASSICNAILPDGSKGKCI